MSDRGTRRCRRVLRHLFCGRRKTLNSEATVASGPKSGLSVVCVRGFDAPPLNAADTAWFLSTPVSRSTQFKAWHELVPLPRR